MSQDSRDKSKKLKQEKPIAMSREYLSGRGACCGNMCRECPYYPRHTAGTTQKYFFI